MIGHVLLIEDDPWLADSYAQGLTKRDYKVSVVTDAGAAMAVIDQQPPDLVVADVMLGASNVLALLHELQSYEDTARIPVVLCSSLPLEEHLDGSLQAYGVVQVVNKQELTPTELARTVELVINESRA